MRFSLFICTLCLISAPLCAADTKNGNNQRPANWNSLPNEIKQKILKGSSPSALDVNRDMRAQFKKAAPLKKGTFKVEKPDDFMRIPNSSFEIHIEEKVVIANFDNLVENNKPYLSRIGYIHVGFPLGSQEEIKVWGQKIVKGIQKLPRVRSLKLQSGDLEDISFLAPLAGQLQSLRFSWTHVQKIDVLCNFTKLTTLNMNLTKVDDLSPLRSVKSLKKLEISHLKKCVVRNGHDTGEREDMNLDITPLKELSNLQYVNIGTTVLKKEGAIQALAHVKKIVVAKDNPLYEELKKNWPKKVFTK